MTLSNYFFHLYIPATLSLKEATGVCSGSATAFNVNSTSFESSKLKFYREMLYGVHEKNNASTKQNAPKATAAEDWFSVAYMFHPGAFIVVV